MPDEKAKNSSSVTRVSTLELFFDLVFVFAITQVSHLFGEAHGALDFGRAFLVLAVVWWMYGGYAWLTSNVGTDRFQTRILLLAAMVGFLIIALRIPTVATRHGSALGLAYLLVVLIHSALFTHAPNSSARAILGVLPFNVFLAVAVIVSGLVPAEWNWIPWSVGAAAIVATTTLRRERDFQLSPAHFVERHGLVILIALGESVVATGTSAESIPIGVRLVAWVTIGLALAAALWWTYFDGDDERAERAIHEATGDARTRLALHAYYYAHLAMIAGIVMTAAGVHDAVRHLDDPGAANAWLISCGVATYLAGAAWFRALLHIGPSRARMIAAGVTLGMVPVGERWGSLLQLVAVVVVLVGMLGAERRL